MQDLIDQTLRNQITADDSASTVIRKIYAAHSFRVGLDFTTFDAAGKRIPLGWLHNLLISYLTSDKRLHRRPADRKLNNIAREDLKAELSLFLEAEAASAKRERAKILLRPRDVDRNELFEEVRALLRFNNFVAADELSELDVWATLQALSHIKHCILYSNGLDSRRPVAERNFLLNFYSYKGGIGKTTFCRYLLKPLQGFAAELTAELLTDSRAQSKAFQLNAFLLDEFNKLPHDSLSTLKSVLTSREITTRVMRANDLDTTEINFGILSTSNVSIYDFIKDPSGHRRYWEITCNSDNSGNEDYKDFEYKINALEIWQALEYGSPYTYLSHERRAEMSRYQAEQVQQSPLDEFILEVNIHPGVDEVIPFVDFRAAYRKYLATAQIENEGVRSQHLAKELSARGFKPRSRGDNGRGLRVDRLSYERFYKDRRDIRIRPTKKEPAR